MKKEVGMIRGFLPVKQEFKKSPEYETILPTRATKYSMAYDFYAQKPYTVKPNEVVKIWTDVKAFMQENEGLIINIRSSMGGKWQLLNQQGWIDCDFFENPDSDGDIGIFLKNVSNETQYIYRGDRIAQGMFINYLIADNGNTDNERTGGFGSTN